MANKKNGDLKGLINFFKHNEKRINKFRIFVWINQILQALHFLHKNNIIHRDVKPGYDLIEIQKEFY